MYLNYSITNKYELPQRKREAKKVEKCGLEIALSH
jgi:hypothetical protein